MGGNNKRYGQNHQALIIITGRMVFVGLEYAVLLHCLKKRFDFCYDEYIQELFRLDAEQLIERASEIVAIKETYYEMRFWIEMSMYGPTGNTLTKEPIKEQATTVLMSLENPLKELGLKWWFYTLGNNVEFFGFFNALDENDYKSIAVV